MHGTLTVRPGAVVQLPRPTKWRTLYVAKYRINGSNFEFTSYDRSRVDTRAAVLVENEISVVLTTRKERVTAHG